MNNIKDFLVMNKVAKIPIQTKKKEIEYTYKLSYNNNIDFIIDKNKNGKLYKQFVVIPSEKLMYIRDKSGDYPVNNQSLAAFFSQMSRDEYNNLMANVNEWYVDFSRYEKIYYRFHLLQEIFCSHYDSDKFKYEIIKRGFKPPYISGNESLYLDDINLFVKILKETKKNNKIDNNELRDLFYIGHNINFNNVLYILDKRKDSDFKITVGDYYNYKGITLLSVIKKYNLDFTTFINYLFDNLYYQGIEELDGDILTIYDDYLNMQKIIYNKIKNKYPDSLKLEHDRLVMKFNLHKQYYQDKIIKFNQEKVKEIEYSTKEYSIILPATSQDIIDEGINLHHCVGSYVEKVKDGITHILFMRKTDDIDKSLITIEFNDNSVLMVRGLQNRYIDEEEKKFIKKWAIEKNINIDDRTCL
jgi:hypothetical protein